MRTLPAALLALALAGCANGEFNPIVVEAVQAVVPGGDDAPDAPAGQPVTRAAITRMDTATIRARLLNDPAPSILFAASENGGYVTYATTLRQTLTLRGSWITGTRGLGWDLMSASSTGPDPLITPIPPSRWPARVRRTYEFSGADAPQGRVIQFDCRFEAGEPQEIVILEVRHRGIAMTEICESETLAFEALHLADAQTGFVWRSLQWLGPQQGLIDLEIVLPFTGRRG